MVTLPLIIICSHYYSQNKKTKLGGTTAHWGPGAAGPISALETVGDGVQCRCSGQLVRLTRNPHCLVPKLAWSSFYRITEGMKGWVSLAQSGIRTPDLWPGRAKRNTTRPPGHRLFIKKAKYTVFHENVLTHTQAVLRKAQFNKSDSTGFIDCGLAFLSLIALQYWCWLQYFHTIRRRSSGSQIWC